MGSVYLARHVSTRQPVAIKIIAAHLAQSGNVALRFETEARAVMRINHPNVIRIFDFGRLPDGTLYHVMEVLNGVELTRLIEQKGSFTPTETLPLLHQICMGLQAAHDQAIVHRDLKPENIFVQQTPDGFSVKLLDFGIAKLLDPDEFLNLTSTGIAIGTPMFIAPEQAMGAKDLISPRTDLYSLGIILYNMLSGTLPFRSAGIGALLAAHIEATPPPLRGRAPRVPETVAAVVHQCLAKEPGQRPASAMALFEAFDHAMARAGDIDLELCFEPRSTLPDADASRNTGRDTDRDTVVDTARETLVHDNDGGDTDVNGTDVNDTDVNDTVIDPRVRPRRPRIRSHSAPHTATPNIGSPPATRLPTTDQIPASVLLGQPTPRAATPSRTYWLAMGGAILGVLLIILLLGLALSMIL